MRRRHSSRTEKRCLIPGFFTWGPRTTAVSSGQDIIKQECPHRNGELKFIR